MRWRIDGYDLDDATSAVDRDAVFEWLTTDAYWWADHELPRPAFEAAIDASLCLSAFGPAGHAIGFARMVTDQATFAYLCDVYVPPQERGRGIGGALVAAAVRHPAVASCRRVLLATRDAHELYRRFGFEPLASPRSFMELQAGTGRS